MSETVSVHHFLIGVFEMSWTSDAVALSAIADDPEKVGWFQEFLDGAVACLAWTTPVCNSDGEDMGVHVDETVDWDCDTDEIQESVEDGISEMCLGFFVSMFDVMVRAGGGDPYVVDWSQMGHDYVLTANGHGAGFWDRGYPRDISDALCDGACSVECAAWIDADNELRVVVW